MSEAETRYVLDGLTQGLRNDGRALTGFRGFSLSLDVIPQANASVRVFRTDDLDVTVGVKCELSDEAEVRLSIEQHPELETLLRDCMLGSIDLGSLQAPWSLNIDVLVGKTNGALVDMIAVGIYAALAQLKLPRCAVRLDEGKKKVFMDEKAENFVDLQTEVFARLPLVLSLGLVADNLLFVDPDALEEQVLRGAGAGALVAVIGEGSGVCGVRKFGLGALDAAYLPALLNSASQLLAELRKTLTEQLL